MRSTSHVVPRRRRGALRRVRRLALTGGVAYDRSMISDSTRTVLTPLGAAWRFGLGVQWAVSRTVSLGLYDTFVWGGTCPWISSAARSRGACRGRSATASSTWSPRTSAG